MNNLNSGLGIWQLINSNIITDIISSSGFDYTLLDLEHGFFDLNSIQNCVLASKSTKLKTIVRLPSKFYMETVRIIDTGINGILFPHIENQEDLEIIIKKTFLPPKGEKSLSPFVPKYNYGLSNSFDNTDPFLGILVESSDGMKNLSNLISNKFIDFVYYGAYDLSIEYEIPGKIFDLKILDNLKYLKNIASKNNKKIMSIYRTKEELEILNNIGVDIPIASVDTSHISNKLKNEYDLFRKIKGIYP